MRMHTWFGGSAIALFILSIAGCAGVSVSTVGDTDTPTVDGIRYYEQVPFLLVYSDAKGGVHSELLYLPDTTRIRTVDPYAWMASNNLTLTFDKGVLTSEKLIVDETVVPKALVEAAKTALMASFDAANKSGAIPPPALFRLWVTDTGALELIGGYGLDAKGEKRQDIHVTVSQPPDKKKEPAAAPVPAPDGKKEPTP